MYQPCQHRMQLLLNGHQPHPVSSWHPKPMVCHCPLPMLVHVQRTTDFILQGLCYCPPVSDSPSIIAICTGVYNYHLSYYSYRATLFSPKSSCSSFAENRGVGRQLQLLQIPAFSTTSFHSQQIYSQHQHLSAGMKRKKHTLAFQKKGPQEWLSGLSLVKSTDTTQCKSATKYQATEYQRTTYRI